ncbi:hypothetical protein T4A_4452 [Trichinella pseudospiralis]|uniref:Uncharacterized protein n=1 Tax=Trichinella pseudospiralis TaxID=6337 RepID=A0A0V1EAI2_TRIPS|nr:hypothetical protein T4A_4452 [Trichinella pseudospiralis]
MQLYQFSLYQSSRLAARCATFHGLNIFNYVNCYFAADLISCPYSPVQYFSKNYLVLLEETINKAEIPGRSILKTQPHNRNFKHIQNNRNQLGILVVAPITLCSCRQKEMDNSQMAHQC